MAGLTNGVCLNHRPHKTECNRDRHRKQHRKDLAEKIGERMLDVIDRSAVGNTFTVNNAGFLSKDCFRINRCHPEKCHDPHPEDRTRSTNQDRAGSPHNITRTDLCRHRRGKRLKGAEAPFFFIVEREIAEGVFQPFPETADLDETGPDRKKQPCPDQQNDQHIVRKVLIDQRNNIL